MSEFWLKAGIVKLREMEWKQAGNNMCRIREAKGCSLVVRVTERPQVRGDSRVGL